MLAGVELLKVTNSLHGACQCSLIPSYQVKSFLTEAGIDDSIFNADVDAYVQAASDYADENHEASLGEPQHFHRTIRR